MVQELYAYVFGCINYASPFESRIRLWLTESPDLSMGVGTAQYAAPEQRRSSTYTDKVDIYSAGYVLFELFSSMRSTSERLRVFDRKDWQIFGSFSQH